MLARPTRLIFLNYRHQQSPKARFNTISITIQMYTDSAVADHATPTSGSSAQTKEGPRTMCTVLTGGGLGAVGSLH